MVKIILWTIASYLIVFDFAFIAFQAFRSLTFPTRAEKRWHVVLSVWAFAIFFTGLAVNRLYVSIIASKYGSVGLTTYNWPNLCLLLGTSLAGLLFCYMMVTHLEINIFGREYYRRVVKSFLEGIESRKSEIETK